MRDFYSPGRIRPANRTGSGPLGALPRLSSSARRALAGCGVLAALTGAAVVAQAWALAETLTGHGFLPVLAAAVVARAVLGWATQVVAARAAAGAKEELRATLLDRALALGPEWIAARGPAELTSLATKGLDALDGYFTSYLPALVNAAVVPAGVGAVILLADWPSAVVIALTVPLIPVFAVLIGLYTKDRVARSAESTRRLSGHLLELVRALPVLTAFRRAEAQAEAVRRVSDAHRRASMGTLRVAFTSALVLELVATLSVALVAVIIGLRLVSGDLGLAVGLFVLILAPECYLPLRSAGAAHHASEDGLEAVRRVAEVGKQRDCASFPLSLYAQERDVAFQELVVRDLRVRRRDRFAPDGMSFTARPGEVVRLDGPSGAGKSTAMGVLLGFVQPDHGHIEGLPGRDLIAWVPQRPAFTGGTVADELALAVPEPTRGELETVAGKAVCAQLLDRPVLQLSTGERQRVAVARALLRVHRGARLLLLDEPTAHLDAGTAARVMAAVHAAAAGGVAVVIASHRSAEPVARMDDQPVTSPVPTTGEAPGERSPLRRLITPRLVAGAALGAAALICGVALTATSAWLIAKAAQQPPILTLSVAIVGVRAFGLARAGLRYAERLVTHDAAFRAAADLRARLWSALVRLGPARTLGLRRTEGLQRLVDDADTVRDLTPRVLLPPLVAAGACLVAVAVQFAILPAAGLTLAAAVLLAGLAAPALAVALDRRATAALTSGRRRVTAGVLTLLEAAPDLIAMGTHTRLRATLARTDSELAAQARRQAFGAGAAHALITLATGFAAVLSVGSAQGTNLDPVLLPVLALVPLALAEALGLLPPAAQHVRALQEVRARGVECDEGGLPRTGREKGPLHRTVALHHVRVRWPGAAEPALQDLTLYLPPGAHVAVVGPSGSGKSTLLALLLGFLQPERGTATIPANVAWCPQEPQLVSTTLRENLRVGDPHADDAKLAEALTQAGLDHWADRLDTRLDFGGAAASGGETQRIALARALLAAPQADLVLLDEPTAHLDEPTARKVLANLREALAGKTVVHVTHRPEEVLGADLVLEIA
ncbi:MAG TPA: thiol reductant ABC exporter subunit CydD [Actinophytocola sp.]|uniref:thiol reductant ABC exporter subunit CydD n=1 Tax=Actinophytocola sp. TaxID=1872138 RepID=UPI002DFA7134|nr:thiol reductant ABC exporter subunit CydD [Actinophytocola sp.]